MACRGSGVQIPLAPLLKDTERQARKTLEQFLKQNLISCNFEAELLEISGRKAITEKKTLRMHLRNKLNDSDINYLINKQFTDIEKKHLKL